MKLGIVIGHNSHAQGAHAIAPINASEFEFNSEVAELMDDMAAQYMMDAKVFKRRRRTSYKAEIEEVYGKTDAWGAEATIELHFNAYNGAARGTETLAGPSGKSLRMAMATQSAVADLYQRDGITDRGVKTYRRGMRGAPSLISGQAPAILVEPFFGDVKSEVEMVNQVGIEALCQAYLSGISEAFGVTPHNEALAAAEIAPPTDFSHWR